MTSPVLSSAMIAAAGGALASGLLAQTPPVVSGAITVGGVASITPGTWAIMPASMSFQIKRAGVAVGSPISSPYVYVPVKYTFVAADKGQAMTVDVTALTATGLTIGVQTVALGTPSYRGVFPSTLLPAANDFTSAAWVPGGTTATANAQTAPDGTTTASRVLADATTGGHAAGNPVIARTGNGYVRIQLYARPVGGYDVAFVIDDGTSSNRITQYFSLSAGTAGTTVRVGGGLYLVQTQCDAVDNGYYRCTLVLRLLNTITSLRTSLRLNANGDNGSLSFAGDVTKGLDLWGGQMIVPPLPVLDRLAGSVPIILATDMNVDVDDLISIRLLAALANKGRAQILAAVTDGPDTTAAPALKALLTYSGLPFVPVGAYEGTDQTSTASSLFDTPIRDAFRPAFEVNTFYPLPTQVYRKMLAMADDHTATFSGFGGLVTHRDLLTSPPDQYSNLWGPDLVYKKTQRLVLMGGDYPNGAEHNFQLCPSASAFVLANWPTEIVQIGFTLGTTIYTTMPLDSNKTVDPYQLGWSLAPAGYMQSANGAVACSITAVGSGGTDGVYEITGTGGGASGIGAVVRVTVLNGAITVARIISPGLFYSSAPSFATSGIPGLTGATLTATYGSYLARSSWDPLAAYMAVFGIDQNFYSIGFGPGVNTVDPVTGNNTMTLSEPGSGNATYLQLSPISSVGAAAAQINRLIA